MNGNEYTDERAVSPVIGVILMVAITVILAAVIGTFVLDLGQDAGQSAPQASLDISVESSTDNVTIEHTGGEALQSDRTDIVLKHANGSQTRYTSDTADPLTVSDSAEFSANSGEFGATNWNQGSWSATGGFGITSGDTITIQVIDTKTSKIIYETEITA